jgi:hypothetical protein
MRRSLNALHTRLAVAAHLKKLRWSEFEDRAAYQPLPATWRGEFDSVSPLDEMSGGQVKPVKTQVFGQVYEEPVPLELRAEDDDAFRRFQALMLADRAAELDALQQRRAAYGDDAGVMSNMRIETIYAQPCVEYWRGRS